MNPSYLSISPYTWSNTTVKADGYDNKKTRRIGNETTGVLNPQFIASFRYAVAKIMDNAYTYDKVDNILSIEGSVVPNAEIGGRYKHSYQYDDLYRLTSATGSCRDTIGYTLSMAYNRMSSPTHKNLQDFGSTQHVKSKGDRLLAI